MLLAITRLLVIAVALQTATFSTRTDVVVLPVIVTDARGRAVSTLTRDHFRVYEDGRQQPIVAFQHGDVPLTLGLVVDYSLSMRPKMPVVVAAIRAFAAAARPDDEMFVVSFNEEVVLDRPGGVPFTNDPATLTAVLTRGEPVGATALYDGIEAGLRQLRAGRWDRKALIVVSDGSDNASRQTAEQTRALARASQATIYAIGIRDDRDDATDVKTLRALANGTGGLAYFPSQASDASRLLTEIAADLREQYTLAFTPTAGVGRGRVRRLEVRASSPGLGRLQVRTRDSWSAPVEDSTALP